MIFKTVLQNWMKLKMKIKQLDGEKIDEEIAGNDNYRSGTISS